MKLADIVKNWQLMLTLIAGMSSFMFSREAEIRRRFDVNEKAIQTAERQMRLFLNQPAYMLTYLENAYPEPAYCAALSAVQACVSALDQSPLTQPSCQGLSGRDAEAGTGDLAAAADALAREIDRIARESGLTEAAIHAEAETLAQEVAVGENWSARVSTTVQCDADLEPMFAALPLRERFLHHAVPEECVETLGLYKKTTCGAQLRQRLRMAEGGAAPEVQPPPGAAVPAEPVPEDSAAEPAAPADEAVVAERPAEACPPGGARPVVYPHVASRDLMAADAAVMDELRAKGWSLADARVAEGASSGGDIRFYYPDEAPCADRLAADVAAVEGFERPKLIDLSGRYRNLPFGRMELWMPVR
ncbi:hypothetical protein [Mangrovicoccus sp. HB161399]|uniref:hypothetical protein n=1 Tax=Mangrovicoccus sp. HB161399 TaxID=2720392 RepID=UPI0015560A82|nr:hypothetical protein [Mangrovicoccus sp. HB161399]